MFRLQYNRGISHASKGILKIHQARLSQYINWELSDVQEDLKHRKQISKCQHPLDHRKSKRIPKKKKIYFCFFKYANAFDCVDHNKLWKILQEMGMPDHLTCLLRNMYAGQEATVRNRHGKMNCFQIVRGVCQGCIFSQPAYLTYMQSISCEISGWMNHKSMVSQELDKTTAMPWRALGLRSFRVLVKIGKSISLLLSNH